MRACSHEDGGRRARGRCDVPVATFCKRDGERDEKNLTERVGGAAGPSRPHGWVGTWCMHAVDEVTVGERGSRGASMVNAHCRTRMEVRRANGGSLRQNNGRSEIVGAEAGVCWYGSSGTCRAWKNTRGRKRARVWSNICSGFWHQCSLSLMAVRALAREAPCS